MPEAAITLADVESYWETSRRRPRKAKPPKPQPASELFSEAAAASMSLLGASVQYPAPPPQYTPPRPSLPTLQSYLNNYSTTPRNPNPRHSEMLSHAEAWRLSGPPSARSWAYVDETWPILVLGHQDELRDTYTLTAHLYLPGTRETQSNVFQLDRRMIEASGDPGETVDHVRSLVTHLITSLLVDASRAVGTQATLSLAPVLFRR